MASPSPTVPVVSALDAIYAPNMVPAQLPRWQALHSTFSSLFGRAPDFVARSPGRVNVIGEHIDYSLYPVLPMAISADALLAVSSSPAATPGRMAVRIANVDQARFPTREFSVELPSPSSEGVDVAVDVGIDASVHEWSNYFRAGLSGALRLLRQKGTAIQARDLAILMDGTVPAGGGLSSSAAFVSSSALAVLAVLQADGRTVGDVKVDRSELTEVAIVSEREVGVNSGGMDQSASILSERDAALLVSFYPKLSSTPVSFPATEPSMSFVIAQSFVAADKHVTGPVNYNLRVVECTLAAEMLHRALNPASTSLPKDGSPLGVSLRGFHERYFENKTGERRSLDKELEELVAVTRETLSAEAGYTLEEIAQALDTTVEAISTRHLSTFPVRATHFKLRQRALHVFSEALRVQRFMNLLNSSSSSSDLPRQLGEILNQSQASCRDFYECSCPELDDICAIARDAGALGSRLTGAGWGGCSVHIVGEPDVGAVTEAWAQRYYKPRGLEGKEGAVVVTKPGPGSVLFMGSV